MTWATGESHLRVATTKHTMLHIKAQSVSYQRMRWFLLTDAVALATKASILQRQYWGSRTRSGPTPTGKCATGSDSSTTLLVRHVGDMCQPPALLGVYSLLYGDPSVLVAKPRWTHHSTALEGPLR